MKALQINTDGTVEIIVNDDKFVGYSTLSGAVGGMIECVTFSDTLTMWVNEEGKMCGLPVNEYATRLFVANFGPFDTIVGNAILTGGADDDGETLGLTDGQIADLVAELVVP